MLNGISFKVGPTDSQKCVLSQWMGCARFIWNAKCDEEKYQYAFARRYLPMGTYPAIDAKYSKYKNPELTPWLSECPSQILRNSTTNWYYTYKDFLKGKCGKPKRKRKGNGGSIYLTRELFQFEECEDGVTRLFIGAKRNNIGYLSVKMHRKFEIPNSITIKQRNGRYTVSFCYEDGMDESLLASPKEHLEYLRGSSKEQLEKVTIGIDRGVKIPVQAGNTSFTFSERQVAKKKAKERYIRRQQKRLSKQKKGSRRQARRKRRISRAYEKIANIRRDFCHKTSRTIVDEKKTKVIVLEDLKTSNMTKSPKAKPAKVIGRWERNGSKRKAGLNRAILDKGWHQFETFVMYKSKKAGKVVFKVPAHYTSQECADCGHTHPSNRISQEAFQCRSCGHTDNADRNAAKVIKKRAINLIMDSGTELSNRLVLLDSGRGAAGKPRGAKASRACSKEASKKKEKAFVA